MADHTCPVWIGYLLASPLRKLIENPNKILKPHIKEGMTALDVGSAMGFFSLPLTKMVGKNGHVICVDLQQKMLDALVKRARKAGVAHSIKTRLASDNSLNIDDLKNTVDIALAFHIVHEVNNPKIFFTEILNTLKNNGKLLFSEPPGHVSKEDFNQSLGLAESIGFTINQTASAGKSRFAVLTKTII
jgi:ubiquinone/menaquinone biosynthesis C-methylase UbiE